MKKTASFKCFGGEIQTISHPSISCNCTMTFSIFLPRESFEQPVNNNNNNKIRLPPIIYYLSGLTCTDQNALTKGGFQRDAAQRGVAIIYPDTSPRGVQIEGDSTSWDFGVGAGFYLNATEEKWKNNYRMYDYITKELPSLLEKEFPKQLDHSRRSIFGHSMGGHGALICALKNPGMYTSVSAFAPICNPMNCPWGVKAFSGYLGSNRESWREWDASQLAKTYVGPSISILVDQGSGDQFLTQKQLMPDALVEAVKTSKHLSLQMRLQEGYDHSYYFMSTFSKDHIDFHADALGRESSNNNNRL
jgi:S-formylglutathione hydrolase